jgi:hypothetical protein
MSDPDPTSSAERVPACVIVQLDERVAEELCALLGGIGDPSPELAELFENLNAVLPHRRVSYSDLFVGQTRAKA